MYLFTCLGMAAAAVAQRSGFQVPLARRRLPWESRQKHGRCFHSSSRAIITANLPPCPRCGSWPPVRQNARVAARTLQTRHRPAFVATHTTKRPRFLGPLLVCAASVNCRIACGASVHSHTDSSATVSGAVGEPPRSAPPDVYSTTCAGSLPLAACGAAQTLRSWSLRTCLPPALHATPS